MIYLKNNLNIEKKLFSDHYEFAKNEIENIIGDAEKKDCQIVMTEKDYFKINNFNLKKINYLVSLEINEIDKILDKIKNLHD